MKLSSRAATSKTRSGLRGGSCCTGWTLGMIKSHSIIISEKLLSKSRLRFVWAASAPFAGRVCRRVRHMNFEFTEEQKLFADSVQRFAQANLAADALKRAHEPRFPFEVAQMMAEQGLLGITIPEEDGGLGGSLMDAVIAIEQVASVCPRSADTVQAGNFGPIRTFAEYATDDQKKRFLPGLLAGKAVVSLGMTEPEAGSAATELRTTAKAEGDEFVINGAKIFSTHSPDASSVSDLRPLWARRRRHRLGAGREGHSRLHRRPAIRFHERGGMEPALFRELPYSGGQCVVGARGV
ncbi:MAG: acyl-CoA dehydrogenase family protein [Pseudolabrys sp.]